MIPQQLINFLAWDLVNFSLILYGIKKQKFPVLSFYGIFWYSKYPAYLAQRRLAEKYV